MYEVYNGVLHCYEALTSLVNIYETLMKDIIRTHLFKSPLNPARHLLERRPAGEGAGEGRGRRARGGAEEARRRRAGGRGHCRARAGVSGLCAADADPDGDAARDRARRSRHEFRDA